MSMAWHILDAGSIWLKEFAYEMGQLVPTVNWSPEFRLFGHWETRERTERLADPKLELIRFPLQRGYSKSLISRTLPFERRLLSRLKARCERPKDTVLMCTTPFYAPIAEAWPGPVVYYLTDLTKKYAGMDEAQVVGLDTRMCRAAIAVFPNSERIKDYLNQEAACPLYKLTVIPNATREQNVLESPLFQPSAGPADLAALKRPIIGIIGNLAGNMNWQLLDSLIERTQNVSWAFVGPTDMPIEDHVDELIRQRLMNAGGRVAFLGPKKYSELAEYARSFDAALMPYRKKEPTYSGSATRFYEHLAATRPMIATRGFHELLGKRPLVRLADEAEEIRSVIEDLRENGFRDNVETLRWKASKEGTWRVRVRDLLAQTEKAIEQVRPNGPVRSGHAMDSATTIR